MCYVICQEYNFDNATKKGKGVITYNQQHGTI
jgi:hypothetical protein